MYKPSKTDPGYALADYDITITLLMGLPVGMVGGIVGFLVGGIINDMPRHPFEVLGLAWLWVPALVGYFIPLVLDIIQTNKINKPRKKRFAVSMANYNEYVKQTKCNELETFIKECKS
ncbi:head outer capsid protein [Escherichia phage vB_EcoM_ESCO10]|nr:head outer capsid protein [Escherichia phage vB_EcoM_ESCO10]